MTTTPDVNVTIVKGRSAGHTGRVIQTYGKQSVWVEGAGSVFRRSLTLQSQRDLLAAEADVTWAWLTETMTVAEADAWLGRN